MKKYLSISNNFIYTIKSLPSSSTFVFVQIILVVEAKNSIPMESCKIVATLLTKLSPNYIYFMFVLHFWNRLNFFLVSIIAPIYFLLFLISMMTEPSRKFNFMAFVVSALIYPLFVNLFARKHKTFVFFPLEVAYLHQNPPEGLFANFDS